MSVAAELERYRGERGAAAVALLGAAAGRGGPAVAERLGTTGLTAGAASVEDLESVPVLKKDDLPALQRRFPPSGGLLPGDAVVVRYFASPGPIYEAQPDGPDPWGWAPALSACGIGPGDVVLNCFSYHLSPAGAMFDEACRALGAVVVPGGVGSQDVQARAIADLGVTAYVGLPSYLAALVEAFDGQGHPADRWRLGKALVTAEPLPVELRQRLLTRLGTVLMAYGTAEVGLIGYERVPGDALRVPERVYVEVCDPVSGRSVPAGEVGEVVVSVLRPESPLLRFGTGDLSRWVLAGDGGLGLAGVLGRVGAAVKVRGMFVHPSQAREVLEALRAAGAASGRFRVDRDPAADRDVLVLDLVPQPGVDTAELTEAAVRRTREALRVRPEVRLVDLIEGEEALVDARDRR